MKCRSEVRELVVWAAGKELEAAERRSVEQHVAGCVECRELMAFAEEMKRAAKAQAATPKPAGAVAWHPDADTLVRWVEGPQEMRPTDRARIAEHVSGCAACTAEVAILEEVGVDDRAARPSRAHRPSIGNRLRRWLTVGIPVPIPATAVLGAAIVTVALLLRGPEQGGEGFVAGPVLLSDTRAAVRGGAAEESAVVDAGTSPLFLLELMDLAAPPDADAVFRIVLVAGADPHTGGEPVWEREIPGRDFADTYSLAVQLPADILRPGDYTLRVLAPDGRVVFAAAVRGR